MSLSLYSCAIRCRNVCHYGGFSPISKPRQTPRPRYQICSLYQATDHVNMHSWVYLSELVQTNQYRGTGYFGFGESSKVGEDDST
jgi:hypothetical protein